MAPVDVVFGRYHVTQPDLLFISRERLGIIVGGKVHGAPDLIIEILSPGTRDHDLGWKKTLYAREGVRDYWIGDPLAKTVLPLTLGSSGYAESAALSAGDLLSCPLFPGISTDIARLFA